MPRSTWNNLDPEKRKRVLQAALAEFAERGFTAGSLNTIAREARVSKGSLFQYFDDKLDLWATVAGLAGRQICEAIEPSVVARRDAPFRDQIRGLILDWADYCLNRPVEQAGAVAVSVEPDRAARTVAREASELRIARLVDPLLELPNALRPDVDRTLARAQLIVLLRHLATAPFQPGEDPTLDLLAHDEPVVRETAARLADAYVRAWGAPGSEKGEASPIPIQRTALHTTGEVPS